MRWIRGLGIALAMVLVSTPAAGAGSGSGDEAKSTAETFIDLVRDAWNEDPALVALRARDKGYDLEQTLDAMGDEDRQLGDDGTITEKGQPVAPAGPAAGVLDARG